MKVKLSPFYHIIWRSLKLIPNLLLHIIDKTFLRSAYYKIYVQRLKINRNFKWNYIIVRGIMILVMNTIIQKHFLDYLLTILWEEKEFQLKIIKLGEIILQINLKICYILV